MWRENHTKPHEISNKGSVMSSHNMIAGLVKPYVQVALYQLLTNAYHKRKAEKMYHQRCLVMHCSPLHRAEAR